MALLDKLLVANRGEIAQRIIRSAKLLGIRTVAIYRESEKDACYVRLADETVSLGNDELNATFLNIDRIIDIAILTGSCAIHPGYGFLSENPAFAMACKENQIIFVGPEPEVLRLMGNKIEAKKLAVSLGIPVVRGQTIDHMTDLSALAIDFPVMVKASSGGGGKGMKIVENPCELSDQLKRASRIAFEYFGNGELFVEQYIRNARHVEVQILCDKYGNSIHLYERECSIQRNHQKILEEAPAMFLTTELRGKILSDALKIAIAVNYSGAGTVEFLVDGAGNYFFMEMNPRIQVEHAVTEQVTGIDIVSEQLRIASGYPLSRLQEQVITEGHAIEVRAYAEDPAREFCPSSYPLLSVNLPVHPNIRIEADLENQQSIINDYDPLLLKIIARAENRENALKLLVDSIHDLNIIGPETNVRYLEMILKHDLFQSNVISTEFCQTHHQELTKYSESSMDPTLLPFLLGLSISKKYLENDEKIAVDPWKYTGYWRLPVPEIPICVDGKNHKVILTSRNRPLSSFSLTGKETDFKTENCTDNCVNITIRNVQKKIYYQITDQGDIRIGHKNVQHHITFPGSLKNYPETGESSDFLAVAKSDEITSPLYGKILDIFISENQLIKKGDPLIVIEAMKTENHILSHKDARVKKIAVKVGAQVTDRMPLIILED